MCLQKIEVTQHLSVEALQRLRIAIVLIELIRNLHNGAAPAAGTAAAAAVGSGILDMAGIYILAVADITNPLPVEGFGIQNSHARVAHQLAVTGITPALQMRTVGRNTGMHIAQLGIDKCVKQPIKRNVVAPEGSGHIRIRMDDPGAKQFCLSLYLDIAVSKPGKHGLDDPPGAVGHKLRLLHTPAVDLPQGTVRHEQLRHSNLYPGTLRSGKPQNRQVGAVSTDIVDTLHRGAGNRQHFKLPVRRAVSKQVLRIQRLGSHGVGPCAVIESKTQRRIVKTDVVVILVLGKVIGRYEAVADLVGAGRYDLLHSFPGFQDQPVDCLGISEAGVFESVPAAAKMKGQYILTGPDQFSHIVLRYIDPVTVNFFIDGVILTGFKIRGQGQKAVLGDLFAVDIAMIETQAQHTQSGFSHFTCRKMTAENGKVGHATGIQSSGSRCAVCTGADPLGLTKHGFLVHKFTSNQSRNSSLMVTPKSRAMARRLSSVMVWRTLPPEVDITRLWISAAFSMVCIRPKVMSKSGPEQNRPW